MFNSQTFLVFCGDDSVVCLHLWLIRVLCYVMYLHLHTIYFLGPVLVVNLISIELLIHLFSCAVQ